MKSAVMGLVMLAVGSMRGREAAVSETSRSFVSAESPIMSTTESDVMAGSGGDGQAPPGAADVASAAARGGGDWQVACELRTGAELIFDRGSLRELGAMTLVRWAAPGDPRVEEPVYTALVSCGEKSIEATWPGKRSGTRAGTCGRRLVEAVCEASAKPRRRDSHAAE